MEKKFYLVRLYSEYFPSIWDEWAFYAKNEEEIEKQIDVVDWGAEYESYAVGSESDFEDEEDYEYELDEYYNGLGYNIKEVSLPELKELGFEDGNILEI